MASSAGTVNRVLRLAGPALLPAIAYGAYKGNATGAIESFFTGPGRTSRIIALVVVLFNWKSLPMAWTVRVWSAMVSHFLFRRFHTHTPDKLFHPVITSTHVSLLEVDYNLHKSNSTYFADLDVSRSHLVSHLFARGCRALAHNATTKLVVDPSSSTSEPARGKFGVMLGAVHCSFRREIAPYQAYETWSRVLGWDRKWMYIVTHFVEKGAVRPRSWDAGSFGATRKTDGEPQEWERKIFATAVSKYVFKIGRLTVHPVVVIGESGLLPERPGGWVAVEDGAAQPAGLVTGGELPEANPSEWDWRRTEEERRKGEEFVRHFASLDGLHSRFDGGEDGALGRFGLG
ncbi:Uu.00g096020.m01.CDS01 [Anthostomella pinea]|uniref:Uu.00g096020.m01.CDS01 n=1 Tax=Anthostomella pinea TaxID=933095 RepID=A0AAI8V737_9PEZI|nr:Uu.00g096020.m01.CDS01 [Anthostomella pinea]